MIARSALALCLFSGCASGDDDNAQPGAGSGGAPAGGVGAVGGLGGVGGSMMMAGGVGGSTMMAGSGGMAGSMAMAGSDGMAGSIAMAGSGGMAGSMAMAGSGGMAGSMAMAGSGGMAGGGGTLGGALMYTSAFTMGTTIPAKNKCPMDVIGGGMGDNVSPLLSWTGGPAETKSFAIVLYDTMYSMLHWVIWDIPPTVNELPEGLASGYALTSPAGAHQAASMGTDPHAYYGPCSSGALAGTYEYRLYALNKDKLDLTESSTGEQAQMAVEAAMLEKVVWSGKPQ